MTQKYDLKAMGYCKKSSNRTSFNAVFFFWENTPQGYSFWQQQRLNGLDYDGRAALAEMAAQWELENSTVADPDGALETVMTKKNRMKYKVHPSNVERLLAENKALRMAYTGEIAPIERFNDDALLGENS